jgi:hypothetical protein
MTTTKTYGEMTDAERKAAKRKIVADEFSAKCDARDAQAVQRLQAKMELKK